MGQQQLLLLVMGVIIVGFAVIAGFAMGQSTMRQAAVDNLVDRNLTIATEAAFWKQKRDPFNGGNASYAGLATDGMQKLFLGETTVVGYFKITRATPNELEVTAVSIRYPEIGVQTFVEGYEIIETVIAHDGSIQVDL
jgi:hypothetical protein